jgi:hypothetical protein
MLSSQRSFVICMYVSDILRIPSDCSQTCSGCSPPTCTSLAMGLGPKQSTSNIKLYNRDILVNFNVMSLLTSATWGSHCTQYRSMISSRLHTHYQADYHTHLLQAWQHVLERKWWYSWSIETIVQSNKMILIQDLGLHQPQTPLTTTLGMNGTESMTIWEWENTSLCVETPHNTHGNTWHPSQNT